jgi:Kip1 ubiquitination-promoting complex protein 1
VGNDADSWGYDGSRICKINDNKERPYGLGWKAGDVIGCLVDMESQEMEFTLNGKFMGVAFTNFKNPCKKNNSWNFLIRKLHLCIQL